MARLKLVFIFGTFLAPWNMAAQPPLPRSATVELPDTREAQLVALRLTHADGQRVGFSSPLKVRETSTFEGEVANLPLGASVWLAVRQSGAPGKRWSVLFPAATTDESGHWQDRVEIPCFRAASVNRCELMALISDQVGEERPYDDQWLRRSIYKRTESVEIQLLPPEGPQQPSASLRIGTIADTPANATQPVVTPTTFGIDGSSENLPKGTPVWALANCVPTKAWETLGQTVTDLDGTWRIRQLTLPPIHGSGNRGCAFQVFAGTSSPPPPPLMERRLTDWTAIRSTRLQLIRNPYFLSISSVLDTAGKQLQPTPESTKIAISGAVASMEVEADQLPTDVRLWQLLRCEGCGSWLAFGPAQLLESGRFMFDHPRFRFPARPLVTRYATMVIASREALQGKALTADDIARTAIGISRVIPIEHATPGRTSKSVVTLVTLNGEPIDAKSGPFQSAGNLLTAICKAVPLATDQSVFVGYREVPSGRWFFHGATQTGDSYRVLAELASTQEAPRDEANSALVPVLAESLPTDRAIQEEWWSEMTTAIGDSVPFVQPSMPWHRRVGNWLAKGFATLSTLTRGDGDDSVSQPEEASMNWSNLISLVLVPLSCILLMLVAVSAWRQRMGARVVLNAWLDARARNHKRVFASQPFERVIQAWTDAGTLAIQKKSTLRISKLRGELAACEDQIRTTYEPEYERLKTKTGRHDASVALGGTAHRILLLVLTVGESAFNLAVFYVFREPAVYTLLMAMAIAVAIPICAFSVGLWIRRWQSPWIGTAVKLLTTVCVLGLAIVGLNHVRMAHLSTVAPAFVREHPELDTAFLSFNAMIFLAAAMVTYWAHDPEENFAESKHKIERLRKRASRLRSALAIVEDQLRSGVEQQKEYGKYYAALYRTVLERRSPPEGSGEEARATS